MKSLRITVKDKIATYLQRDGVIVCGNKGYKIAFTFDEEWDAYASKTARFIWNGIYFDKTFTGDECDVPVINDATEVTVGVYAGDLKTTTPAVIPCLISILCGNPEAGAEMVKEYREEALIAAEEAKTAAKQAKAAAEVVIFPVVDVTNITNGHRVTITDVEGTKTFDVMDGEGALTGDEAALLERLSKWYDDEHYEVMTATFTMSPTSTTYEIGAEKSVKFSWTFSKLPIEVTFNGVAQNNARSGYTTAIVSSAKHATLSYELYGKYAQGETVTKSLSINFRNKYYYGCSAHPAKIDSAFIRGLVSNGWANSKIVNFTPNCTAGTYVWYAYPKRLGAATMWMGGFQGGFEAPQTVSFTNDSGFTEDYYVYHSTNSGIGNLSIEAK